MEKTEYTKLRTKILGIIEGLSLIDARFFNVRKAITYAEKVHCYKRKDGNPEFSHQLEMLSLALSFHNSLSDPYSVYLAIIVHDTIEDYPEEQETLEEMFPDAVMFSRRLSKFKQTDNGDRIYQAYFDKIASCEVCSVVKLIDRIHNLSTAVGVFSTEKLAEYCDEVEMYFVDMLKSAKNQFNQREVYEVLKFMLMNQVRTIRKFLVIIDAQTEETNKTFTAQQLLKRLKGI